MRDRSVLCRKIHLCSSLHDRESEVTRASEYFSVQGFPTKVRLYIQDQPAFMDGISDVTVESEVSG